MSLSQDQLDQIRDLQLPLAGWFSIENIVQRDRELLASLFIHRDSGKEVAFPHATQDVYRKLDAWAARLMEQELRLYEMHIAEKYLAESLTPTAGDDASVLGIVTQYIESTEQAIKTQIETFTCHAEEDWEKSWSKLRQTAKRLRIELSITIQLNGELTRLEAADSGYEPLDRIGFAQTKIERFYAQYHKIPHPFDGKTSLRIAPDELNQAVRLLVYVVFHPVNEPRLSGYENKFVGSFSRYLTCPRDASGSAVEQVAALFEPFLRKLSCLFDLLDAQGQPIARSGLEHLISGLHLTSSNPKNDKDVYWQGQNVEDAVFRLAYQLRHKGAHEAHDYPYYERERNAYFVFAALLLASKQALSSIPKIATAMTHQAHVDLLRALFVRIDELIYGPYGPRIDAQPSAVLTRLEKLVKFSQRAQALWPTCSITLAQNLESEYLCVKNELTEADREADIESYLEDMRGDQY